MATNNNSVTSSEHLLGRVKWFNNKAGYGFITVTDGSRSGSDIFVHHSAIGVVNQQYKYLVQGEYVEFDLVRTESQTHEWQASNVGGIKGGKLMCETRHDLKVARNEYNASRSLEPPALQRTNTTQQSSVSEPRQRTSRQTNTSAPRARGEGPRGSSSNKKNFTLETKNGQKKSQGRSTNAAV